MMHGPHFSAKNVAWQTAEWSARFSAVARQLVAGEPNRPQGGRGIGITGWAARGARRGPRVDRRRGLSAQSGRPPGLGLHRRRHEATQLRGARASGTGPADPASAPESPEGSPPTGSGRPVWARPENVPDVDSLADRLAPERFVVDICRARYALSLLRLPEIEGLRATWGWLLEADGALLVIEAGMVPLRSAELGVRQIRKAGVPILGSVFIDAM